MAEISVIMPAYRVEKYIERAVNSLLDQTMTDFELIIVDDGSPDRTGELADDFAARDGRVRVIHQPNAGAPAARNRAMDEASGRYFFFMDADDWAESHMLEALHELAEKNDLQVAVAGFYIDTYYDEAHFWREKRSQPDQIFPSRQAFREQAWRLFDKNLLYTPWNKLYRADYLREKGVRFPDTFWDDFPFNLHVFADIERVGVTGEAYYHFIRARAESETARYRPDMYEKREEEHGWMLALYQRWGVADAASLEMIHRRYAERVVGCVENIAGPGCALTRREKISRVRAMLKSERLRESLRVARARSIAMKALFLSMKTGCAALVYAEGCVISFVKRRFTRAFARLKAAR